MNKHTPGPWEVETLLDESEGDALGFPWHDARITSNGRDVCKLYGVGMEYFRDPEQQANARLIASAPDLLAALKHLLDDWERVHGPIPDNHEARAAILKAEGGAE